MKELEKRGIRFIMDLVSFILIGLMVFFIKNLVIATPISIILTTFIWFSTEKIIKTIYKER